MANLYTKLDVSLCTCHEDMKSGSNVENMVVLGG